MGRGLDPAAVAPPHLGLEGVRLIGGQDRIASVVGQGAKFRVPVPLVTAAADITS